MSFSSDIKEELSKVNNLKDIKILEAEFLGYILTGNTINNNNVLEFVTENEFNIERFYKILFNLEIDYEPSIRGKVFVAKIKKTEKVEKFMQIKLEVAEEVQKAIVKGSFLGAGSVTDPEKQYHLEIIFQEKNNAEYILNICKKFGIYLKSLENKSRFCLYIKDAEEISKFLALIGANKGVLNFEDVRVTKEIKNNVNRLVNCETANLNKIVNASVNQTLARSLNTSITTLLTLGALYFFGGSTTKEFILAMILGIAVGTYSSIFFASVLLAWDKEIRDKNALKKVTV